MAKGDPSAGGSGYFPAVYQSALSQNAKDYDSIMGQYKDLGAGVKSEAGAGEKVNYSPVSPTFAQYQPGSNYDYLRDFTQTGGYSSGDVSDLRARAVSPIRSIYDSANRNLLRQKNLQGGYSPNFGAAQAKMAREQSNLISGQTTNANAGIAEMVQRGKLAGATALAPLEASETAAKNNINLANTTAANNVAMFNANKQLEVANQNNAVKDTDFNKILESIRGQQSTYGTTPAMTSTIGSQTLNAANLTSSLPGINKGSMSAAGGMFAGAPVNSLGMGSGVNYNMGRRIG